MESEKDGIILSITVFGKTSKVTNLRLAFIQAKMYKDWQADPQILYQEGIPMNKYWEAVYEQLHSLVISESKKRADDDLSLVDKSLFPSGIIYEDEKGNLHYSEEAKIHFDKLYEYHYNYLTT